MAELRKEMVLHVLHFMGGKLRPRKGKDSPRVAQLVRSKAGIHPARMTSLPRGDLEQATSKTALASLPTPVCLLPLLRTVSVPSTIASWQGSHARAFEPEED